MIARRLPAIVASARTQRRPFPFASYPGWPFTRRLLRNSAWPAAPGPCSESGQGRRSAGATPSVPRLGGRRGGGVLPELEQVVRRVDQPPLRATRRSAASQKAVAASVELRVGKDGLDHALAVAVELAAALR